MKAPHDTIAAPVTAAGHAAISVVRVSGPKTREVAEHLLRSSKQVLSSPRRLEFTAILDLPEGSSSAAGRVLDNGLVAFFAAPNSFTGEDVLEFNLHGSPYLLNRLLRNLEKLGVRPARPGEFSERAYLNGRIDLAQAEAIADLIAAETESQAKVAEEQLSGKLSQAVLALGEPLRDVLAEIEAYIDFPEEGIPPLSYSAWGRLINSVATRSRDYLETFSSGRILREGASVVLVGLPNAGKSSLLNRLLGEERVIVTPVPGTTRDSIEERISLDGLFIRLWDTAGLSDERVDARVPDEVEKLGIARSWKKAAEGELVVYIYDSSLDFNEQRTVFERVREISPQIIIVANKSDIHPTNSGTGLVIGAPELAQELGIKVIPVSAVTGAGVKELRGAIKGALTAETSGSRTGGVIITSARHFVALKQAQELLVEAAEGIQKELPPEIIALNIRAALGALNEIVGVTHTEEILGRIFSKFCIGK